MMDQVKILWVFLLVKIILKTGSFADRDIQI